jgi:hypothetical protein
MFRAQNAAGEHKTDTASKITADSSRHSAWLAPRPIPNLYRIQLLEPLQAVRDLATLHIAPLPWQFSYRSPPGSAKT